MAQTDLVISQGPLSNYEEIEKSWDGVAPVLHSCWKDDYSSGNGSILRLNRPEVSGPQNVFLQQKSTLAGLYWAKEKGFKKVIKIRSDMWPTSAKKFVKLLDGDLSFLFWHNWRETYPLDYFQFGDVDALISLWEFNETPEYPEQSLSNNFFNKSLNKLDVNFIGQYLTKENDLYWSKRNIYISDYNSDPLYLNKIVCR